MLFNSFVFILAFMPVVIGGYLMLRRLPNANYAIGFLALASLFYYAWWKFEYIYLILGSVSVNLFIARVLVFRHYNDLAMKSILIAGVAANLGLLGYFKYANFFADNINAVSGTNWIIPNIVLPIGISFITFQIIAFLVDAYQGKIKDFKPLNFIFFVTFFPQLIAGPIVHHSEIMPQLAKAPKRDFGADFAVGSGIFIVGLFKKVIIADTIAIYADAGYGVVTSGQPLDFVSAWITVFSYSFQLYFDFSGYSDMAVGLARMFGIRLPLNFYSPYKAVSFIDFWRRWHITLSRFLRDYLYFTLGGNRHGKVRRYFNLFIVMFLGGLWHGASWSFALWGVIHGILIALNHAWRTLPISQHKFFISPPMQMLAIAFTFLIVTLAWIPFRAPDFSTASTMFFHLFPSQSGSSVTESLIGFWNAQFQNLFNLDAYRNFMKPRELWPAQLSPNYLATQVFPIGIIMILFTAITFFAPNTYRIFAKFKPALNLSDRQIEEQAIIKQLNLPVAIILAAMFVISVLGLSRVSPFLYFQF